MAGSYLNRLTTRHFRAVVLWAMVPMAVWNDRPLLGCICADGHYEAACPNVHKALQASADGLCRCAACCSERDATETTRHCCPPGPDRSADSNQSQQGDGPCRLMEGKSCCRPVIHAPVSPTLVSAVQPASAFELPASHVSMLESACSLDAACICRRVDDDTGQPPRDLVVTLRRLII